MLEEEGVDLECDLLFDDVHGSLSECEEVDRGVLMFKADDLDSFLLLNFLGDLDFLDAALKDTEDVDVPRGRLSLTEVLFFSLLTPPYILILSPLYIFPRISPKSNLTPPSTLSFSICV